MDITGKRNRRILTELSNSLFKKSNYRFQNRKTTRALLPRGETIPLTMQVVSDDCRGLHHGYVNQRKQTKTQSEKESVSLILIAVVIVFFTLPQSLLAQVGGGGGIVIELPKENQISVPTKLVVKENTLQVTYPSGSRLIELPKNALSAVVAWADNDNGPRREIVLSADNVFFGVSPKKGPFKLGRTKLSKNPDNAKEMIQRQAKNQGVEQALVNALVSYDVYADHVACGSVSKKDGGENHPLYAANSLPNTVAARLLDIKGNDSDREKVNRAVQYRKLFREFTTPPVCVGELHMKLSQENRNRSPKFSVKLNRWFVAYKWEQEFNVLNEELKSYADIPFTELTKDMESRWEVYRDAFHPLDELSAIVEAFLVLRITKEQKPSLYHSCLKSVHESIGWYRNKNTVLPAVPQSDVYLLEELMPVDEVEWMKQSMATVGRNIEDDDDVRIAVSLTMDDWERKLRGLKNEGFPKLPKSWNLDPERFDDSDDLTQARVLLSKAMMTGSNRSLPLFEKFFSIVYRARSRLKVMPLWAQSFHWLNEYLQQYKNTSGPQSELRDGKRRQFFMEFGKEAGKALKAPKNGHSIAKDLLAITFGTHLFDLAQASWGSRNRETGQLNDPQLIEFVKMLVKLHILVCRTLDPQSDRMKLHSHDRYLSYLGREVVAARSFIENARQDIQKIMESN